MPQVSPRTNEYTRRYTVTANAQSSGNTGINAIPVGATGVEEDQLVRNKGYKGRPRVVFYNVYYSSAYHTVTITMKPMQTGNLTCTASGLTVTKA